MYTRIFTFIIITASINVNGGTFSDCLPNHNFEKLFIDPENIISNKQENEEIILNKKYLAMLTIFLLIISSLFSYMLYLLIPVRTPTIFTPWKYFYGY